MVFTVFSLASLPRLSTLVGSACSASAIDFNSSAVSGSRGSMPSSALSTPSSWGLLRRFSGAPACCGGFRDLNRLAGLAAVRFGLCSLLN